MSPPPPAGRLRALVLARSPDDHAPLNFPGLQAEAERLTSELVTPADMTALSWGPIIRSHARLLADLTRPESQCFWLRALAKHYGFESAPMSLRFRFQPSHGGMYREGWNLEHRGGQQDRFMDVRFCVEVNAYFRSGDVVVPNIPADPSKNIEALRLALHTAFGVTP